MTRERHGRQEQTERGTIWRYQAVNGITGEVCEISAHGDVKRGWGQHIKVFQKAIGKMGRDGRIGKEGWRVMAFFLERLDWDNWLVIPQREIAEALSMQRQNVSRAVGQLIRVGVLLQAVPPAPRSAYRLSAEFAYRGQYNGWQRRRREEQQEQAARQR